MFHLGRSPVHPRARVNRLILAGAFVICTGSPARAREPVNNELEREKIMGANLKFRNLRKYFLTTLLLIIFALMLGCGNGGAPESNGVISKSGLSISPTSNSEYVVLGDKMDGVAGIELTISYDSASLSSPTVTQGGLISGAMMATNTNTPGKIKIAVISTKSFSGNGQVATVSFATVTGTGIVSISSVNMIDTKGTPIP
jgi:hypothetical protein